MPHIDGNHAMVGLALMKVLSARSARKAVLRARSGTADTSRRAIEKFTTTKQLDSSLHSAAKVSGTEANSNYLTESTADSSQTPATCIQFYYRCIRELLIFLCSKKVCSSSRSQRTVRKQKLNAQFAPIKRTFQLKGSECLIAAWRSIRRTRKNHLPKGRIALPFPKKTTLTTGTALPSHKQRET